jgi:hypothetical protein
LDETKGNCEDVGFVLYLTLRQPHHQHQTHVGMGWKQTQALVANKLGTMVGGHGHMSHAMLHKHRQGKQKIEQCLSPPTH